MRPVLEFSTCLRKSMKDALSSVAISKQDIYGTLLDKTNGVCAPKLVVKPGDYLPYTLRRHFDEQGHFTHLAYGFGSCILCESKCAKEECMNIVRSDVLFLRVSNGSAFTKEGFCPLLAGRKANGHPTYCARLVYSHKRGSQLNFIVCDVAEDETLEDVLLRYRVENAKIVLLYVIVLRYAPSDYPRRYEPKDPLLEKGTDVDATGPCSWRCAGQPSSQTV